MEAAPILLAHSHARNASFETQKANPIAASEEHDLAAGEFANAAKGTADTEALRVLRILEQHHAKLAEILKFKPDEAHSLPSSQPASTQSPDASQSSQPPPKSALSSPRRVSHPPPASIHVPHRESSSSIASNLASARGIPSNRQRWANQSPAQISPQFAEGRVVKPHRSSRLAEIDLKASDPEEKDQAGPVPSSSSAGLPRSNIHPIPTPVVTATGPEDGFARFYSTLNNLVSTLSAPLAFAGLPLNPMSATAEAPSKNEKPQSPRPSRASPAAAAQAQTADPDLTRLFSRAALRAIREENGFGPVAESFYVVPTSGGTMSYAGMLSHARQGSSLTDEDGEFVDARENPQSGNSPVQSRINGRQRGQSTKGTKVQTNIAGDATALLEKRRKPLPGHALSNKTWEELTIENEALKTVAVDLGDRLRAFELGAQKSSLALHASMRQFASPTASTAIVPGKGGAPPLPTQGSSGHPHPLKALEERIKELEEEVAVLKKERKKLEKENTKYQNVIARYRERWESLKEGAREIVNKEGGGSGGNAADGGLKEVREAGTEGQ